MQRRRGGSPRFHSRSPPFTRGSQEGEEAAGNVAEEAAAPEGFFRKTIADVLGGSSVPSWVHPAEGTKETRRLGTDVDIGGFYCVARRYWNPELPMEPGQPGFIYEVDEFSTRDLAAKVVQQSNEFGGVLLAVSFEVDKKTKSRYQFMGYYRVTEPLATTFREVREREPAFFEAMLADALDGARWFVGSTEDPEEEAKRERRRDKLKLKKAAITKRGGGAQREADEQLRAWAAAELEAEVLLKIPFTPVPQPRAAQLRALLEETILRNLREQEREETRAPPAPAAGKRSCRRRPRASHGK
eukprot:tig00020830_g14475.t1